MKIHVAKKSLGQNFLKSHSAILAIIHAGNISNSDTILEIGPGKGILTKELLKVAGQVIAVEKDNELFEFLKIKFEKEIKNKKLILVNDDILEFKASAYGLEPSAYKIIANIPYNITGAILKKFLTAEQQPTSMVLMVQHEVAKRIVARDGKESILSISVKAYGEPNMVMKVPARYFSPAPKVDSAVIAINNISRKNFSPLLVEEGAGGGDSSKTTSPSALLLEKEERFWEMVKAGFAHKRKKLSGNLKSIVPAEKLALFNLENKRAEDLSLTDWISLAKA